MPALLQRGIFRRIGGGDGLQQTGRVGRRRRVLPRTSRERETHHQNKNKYENGYQAGSRAPAGTGEKSHRTTTGTSFFTAQTSATTHPIIVQPRKKLSSTIAVISRLLRARAMIDGRKYITNPKPKNGRKNAGKRCAITTS